VPLTVKPYNRGPLVFTSVLWNVFLEEQQTFTYTLPGLTDPDPEDLTQYAKF